MLAAWFTLLTSGALLSGPAIARTPEVKPLLSFNLISRSAAPIGSDRVSLGIDFKPSEVTFACKAQSTCFFSTVGRPRLTGGDLNFAVPPGASAVIPGVQLGDRYFVSGAPTNADPELCRRNLQQGTFCFEKVVLSRLND